MNKKHIELLKLLATLTAKSKWNVQTALPVAPSLPPYLTQDKRHGCRYRHYSEVWVWLASKRALFNTDDRRHSLAVTFPSTSRFMVLMKQGQWSVDWRASLLCSSRAVTKAQWNTFNLHTFSTLRIEECNSEMEVIDGLQGQCWTSWN